MKILSPTMILTFKRLVPSIRLFQDTILTASSLLEHSSTRHISLTSFNCIKQILEKQEGNTLVVEAVIVPSPRENVMMKSEPESKACPLCRLNLDVKHTDVLILSQFVRKDGCMLPKRITGLCSLQQKRVGYMVTMAHKAGLMGRFKPANSHCDPKVRPDWKKWNTYYEETTIKPPRIFLAMKYTKKVQDFINSKKQQLEQ